jgi:hypothetical protein
MDCDNRLLGTQTKVELLRGTTAHECVAPSTEAPWVVTHDPTRASANQTSDLLFSQMFPP